MKLPPDHWPRLKEVFADARALPAHLRAPYLAVACGGDGALRHEVESLLASDAHATSFLEISPATVERDWALAKAWLYRRLFPRE